jgi:tRNA(Phe) wybutosine-synthesizing methylase Tyw3
MAVHNIITGRKQLLPPKYTSQKKRAGSLDTKAVDLLKGINEEKKSWVTISMVAVNIYISAYFAAPTVSKIFPSN